MKKKPSKAEIEKLANFAYGNRFDSGFTKEQVQYMKEFTIDKINQFKSPEIVSLHLNVPGETYETYKLEYYKIRASLSGSSGKEKFVFPFACFLVDFDEKKCWVMGIIEFRSHDCLQYTAMFLHHLEHIYEITDIEYTMMDSFVFNDNLTAREKRIQMYKFTHVAGTKDDMNDESVIDKVKMTFAKWGDAVADHEYPKQFVFWS